MPKLRYFQYRLNFASDATGFSAGLKNIGIEASVDSYTWTFNLAG